MGRAWSTLALVAVAAGLGAYIYFGDAEKSDTEVKAKVFTVGMDDVEELRVVAKGDTTVLRKTNGIWSMVEPLIPTKTAARMIRFTERPLGHWPCQARRCFPTGRIEQASVSHPPGWLWANPERTRAEVPPGDSDSRCYDAAALEFPPGAALVTEPSAQNSRFFRGLAGSPAAIIQSGTSASTMLRAPITAPAPIVTPGSTSASVATHASGPMVMGLWIGAAPGRVWSRASVSRLVRWLTTARSPIVMGQRARRSA